MLAYVGGGRATQEQVPRICCLSGSANNLSCRRQAVLRTNSPRAVGSTMIATNNTSTHPRDDARAPFCKSVTLAEGRDRASRAGVVTSDFPQRLTH